MHVTGVGAGEDEGRVPLPFARSQHLHSSAREYRMSGNRLDKEPARPVCLHNQEPRKEVGAPTSPSKQSEPFLHHGFQVREQQGDKHWRVNCSKTEGHTSLQTP